MSSRSHVRFLSPVGMLLTVLVVFAWGAPDSYGCGGTGDGHRGGHWGQHWGGHWGRHWRGRDAGGDGATTWYVRTTGRDSNSGTSAAEALRTISKASSRVSAGDTVYVGAGTYNESVRIDRSGTADAFISFVADTAGQQTGDAGKVTVSGSGHQRYGFYLRGQSYVRIQGFDVIQARRVGINVTHGENVIIDGCRVYNNKRGIELKGPDCMVTGCRVYNNSSRGIKCDGRRGGSTVIGCVVYGNRGDGVEVKGVKVAEGDDDEDDDDEDDDEGSEDDESCVAAVYNCFIYANGRRGIKISGRRTDVAICNNTIVLNGREGANIRRGSTGRFINNIFAHNRGEAIKGSRHGTALSDYNLFWENHRGRCGRASGGQHDVSEEPLFRDLSAFDFRLTSKSPARNVGLLSSAPSIDFQGQDRKVDGLVDIGADEFGNVIRVLSWTEVVR